MLSRPLLLLLALATLATPQSPPSEAGIPPLRNYTPADYGFANSFNSIVQDRRGVLLFGTGNNIIEYDGVSWRHIRPGRSLGATLAVDSTGRIWVGTTGDIGYLQADANGDRQFVSLRDQIPPADRAFNGIGRVVVTPQGVYFASTARLFRWDGKRMQVWSTDTRFQALSEVRGRVYTSQMGTGLQEIVGDQLKTLPGGDAYKAATGLTIYPYDDRRMLIAANGEALTLYDGEKVAPFSPAEATSTNLSQSHAFGSSVFAQSIRLGVSPPRQPCIPKPGREIV
jgi:hypothetical protein